VIDRQIANGNQYFTSFYPLGPELIRLIGKGHSVPFEISNTDLVGTGLRIPDNMENTVTGSVSHVSVNMVTTKEFDAALAQLGSHLPNSVLYDRLNCSFGTCYDRMKTLFSIYGDTLVVMYANIQMKKPDNPNYIQISWETAYTPLSPSLENRIWGNEEDLTYIPVVAQELGIPIEEWEAWPIVQLLYSSRGISLRRSGCQDGNLCDGLVFEVAKK
jgi:hypothetical protein